MRASETDIREVIWLWKCINCYRKFCLLLTKNLTLNILCIAFWFFRFSIYQTFSQESYYSPWNFLFFNHLKPWFLIIIQYAINGNTSTSSLLAFDYSCNTCTNYQLIIHFALLWLIPSLLMNIFSAPTLIHHHPAPPTKNIFPPKKTHTHSK